MQRITIQPRADWESIVEGQGMHFHTIDDELYWDESAYYQLTSGEIDAVEKATYALNDLCLEAVQYVIDRHEDLFPQFAIPPAFWEYVLRSWRDDEISIYGRYDLVFDGQS